MSSTHLKPQVVRGVKEALKTRQLIQKKYYDRGVRNLPDFKVGQSIRIRRWRVWEPAVVKAVHESPRSYIVTSQKGQDY